MSALIPVLSIQPLVENAVRHGIASKPGKGIVTVTVKEAVGGLSVQVRDTGVGFEVAANLGATSNGVGLENVRQRLRLCYGEFGSLKIHSDSGGTVVGFSIPSSASYGDFQIPVRPSQNVVP
jgi:two-component system LytT family sensor kinase